MIQSGASTVKTLLIEASSHVSVSNMMANVAAIFGSSKQDLDVYIGDSNIQKLLVDVSNGAVLLKHVVAHNAKILCQQFDAMNDLSVGNLDIKALSHISIQRIQVEQSLKTESGGNTSVSDVTAENAALHFTAEGNARVDGANLNGCTAQIAAQGGASVENSSISNSKVEAKGTSVELSQNAVDHSNIDAQGKSVHMDRNEFARSDVNTQADRAVFEGTQISDSHLHVATKQSAQLDDTSAIGSAINVAAGTDVSINQMKAENSALGVAAQGNALVHGANLNGCAAQFSSQGVTSFEHGDIQGSALQVKGQYVGLSQTTVEQSAVHAKGDVVHMNGNDVDASQITAQGTRIALSENEINNATLQASASESVTVDQTTGTGNTINIESDQVFMADNTLDESRLSVKANRAYIEHLFGSYDDFQLKVNHLRLSGEAQIQNGSITGRDEGVLPYLDISDRFKVGMHSKENTPRPSFVIKCQGVSNLQGLEVEGDGKTHLQAADLTQRPDFTHLEGYAIYLDIAPKTHEDVIKLAQDLSRVANVEINAKDVVLMLESDRIYFSQNLKLHLKGAVLNESTLEGAGDLSLWTSENIESTKSFLSAKGELVAFAGGHLLRTGSKTYSGKGTSLISGGHMQDLAHVDTKETEKIDRHSCGFFSYSTSTTTTTQTSTVCSDVSDASILKFVGGDYEGQGASVQATETNLVFNGKFNIDVAYDFWQEQRGNHYVRSKKTPVPSDFKGAVKIHVNGTQGGSITAPKTNSTMEIIRDESLPPVKISLNLAKITEYAFDAWSSSSCFGLRKHHHQRAVTKEYYQTPQLGGDVMLSGPLTLMYQKAVGHQHKEYLGFFRQIAREITDPLMTQETDYISHLKIAPEQLEEVIIKELYKHEYHKQSHWSGVALMIVAVAASIITAGTSLAAAAGASFASSIGCAGSAFAVGIGTGFTVASISAASVALMQADGNPVKATKSMMNARTFLSCVVSGLTMGTCQWLGAKLNLLSSVNNFAAPALNTAQGIQYAGMCATVNAGIGAAQGHDPLKTLAASGVGIGVQAVGAHYLHLPNAEALQVGLAAAGGAIGGAITDENPLLCAGAGAAGAIMNLMTQDLKIMGIADNWQDAAKQIATVTVSGMAGLNPLYVSSGWQQASMQIQYNRAIEETLRKEKRLLEESIRHQNEAEKVQQTKERIQHAKSVLREKGKHLTKEEQAALEKTFDDIQTVLLSAEALSTKTNQSETAPLQQSLFEDFVKSGLSIDFDLSKDSYIAQALITIDAKLDALSLAFPNAVEVLTKTLEGMGCVLDAVARVSVGFAGFVAGEAACPVGGGLAGVVLAETAYDGVTSAASAGVESGVESLIQEATQKWGPRAGQAVQKLISRGLIVVSASGVVKGVRGVKLNPKVSQNFAKNTKQLLPGEGRVGTYGELGKLSKKGDNLSVHHIPNDQYMKTHGITKSEGISMTVEDPVPGAGGRHREIHKELQRQDPNLAPRDALAQAVSRVREVYQNDGVYTPEIRQSIQEVIAQNKKTFSHLFEQGQ
ncbi:MAG: hypothetical protein CNLJKLNK_01332 [Holosporales bacterium]